MGNKYKNKNGNIDKPIIWIFENKKIETKKNN